MSWLYGRRTTPGPPKCAPDANRVGSRHPMTNRKIGTEKFRSDGNWPKAIEAQARRIGSIPLHAQPRPGSTAKPTGRKTRRLDQPDPTSTASARWLPSVYATDDWPIPEADPLAVVRTGNPPRDNSVLGSDGRSIQLPI